MVLGCRKIDVEPTAGDPVFSVEAKFNGNTKIWQAGLEDYYMFSSFKKDSLDVYEFSGRLAKTDSLDGEVFTVRIRNYKQVSQGLPDINEAVNTGIDFMFASKTGIDTIWQTNVDTLGITTTFDATASILPATPVDLYWNFGDSTFGSTITATHSYTNLPNQPIMLSIMAQDSSCGSSISKPLNTNNSSNCDLTINQPYFLTPINIDSGLVIKLITSGTSPYQFLWNDSSTLDSIILTDDINGVIGASVTVTDATGCTVSGSIFTKINQGTIPPLCVARFNNSPLIIDSDTVVTIDSIITGDGLQLSKIKIEYTDINGKFYSSFLQSQPSSSFIKILKTEDYENNENNEKTKKITLEYNCRLWSETGDFIDITDGKAVIAVAYP